MQIHIATFKWKDGVSRAQVSRLLTGIASLVDHIEGLAAIYWGQNTSKWAGEHFDSDVVVVIGINETAIDEYRKHPLHVSLAAEIESLEDTGLGFDFKDAGNDFNNS